MHAYTHAYTHPSTCLCALLYRGLCQRSVTRLPTFICTWSIHTHAYTHVRTHLYARGHPMQISQHMSMHVFLHTLSIHTSVRMLMYKQEVLVSCVPAFFQEKIYHNEAGGMERLVPVFGIPAKNENSYSPVHTPVDRPVYTPF